MSPRTAATGGLEYGQAASQCSTGVGDSSIGRGGQREVSFAEELHQHLNTFKSFVFRRTSVHLLGSRCALAMLRLDWPHPAQAFISRKTPAHAWTGSRARSSAP
jgi:hypothetical protein